MNFAKFLQLRPFAFHTTAATNLEHLRNTPRLESPRRMFQHAGLALDRRLRERRLRNITLRVNARDVVIRDQRPLACGAIDFEDGWDSTRLVELLNGLVFFWPGAEDGPIDYGRRHFARYNNAGEALGVLRIPTRALIAANAPRQPLLSSCNSGSPRPNPKSGNGPRGSRTFLVPAEFEKSPGRVVELVFEDFAALPEGTECALHVLGPWRQLRPLTA